jgi:diguanylate cyclase (GGDEF)-like protein
MKQPEDGLRKYFEEHQNEIPTWEDDSLTKVKNRTAYDIDFPRLRGNCGILIVDVDFLRESNKKFGHNGADLILRFVALGLETSLRVEESRLDPVYRYGGDEFVIFLPGVTNNADLKKIAERIHSSVTTQKVSGVGDNNYKQGLSIGATIGDFDGNNNIEIFKVADRALYKAKDNGRNRVEVA